MKMSMNIVCIVGLFIISLSGLAAEKENPKLVPNSEQPWSKYKVHDESRPKPPKVLAPGCVSVPAPEGATVLFDGQDTSAFNHSWDIVEGALVANKKGSLKTKENFGSCHLHVEWRVPAGRKFKGQSGGNSGIFIMSRYEIQIQESHTNVTYADGQAAAIYGQTPPQVNASLPQGEWNSYDIIFEAPKYGKEGLERKAYVTLIHNGVVVHSHQVIYGPTRHKKSTAYPKFHPEKAPLIFQWHGDPIEYRNMWVQPLAH